MDGLLSHLDDVDCVFYGPSPRTGVGAFITLAIVIAVVVWALAADSASKDECERHGEKYVDSRVGYTLCEQDGGSVVRR